MSDNRIPYISFLQVLGPVFVILGHSLNGLNCTGWWYIFSKEWIYVFHMPLFFFISGYLLAYKGYLNGQSYYAFIIRKAKRLLLPYLFWNLLFYIPKMMSQAYITDTPSADFFQVLTVFVFPRQNVWGHTWFLAGLFVLYAVSPVVTRPLASGRAIARALLISGCVILYMLPIGTEFLAFSDLHKDLLFFVAGCMLGQIPQERFLRIMKDQMIVFLLFATVTSAMALIWYNQTMPFHFMPCMFILLSLLSIGCSIKKLPPIIERLAMDSFGIYILHWPVMISVRIIMYQIIGFSAGVTALMMCIAGWTLPIIAVEWIRMMPIQKIRKPLKYLLGV